MRLERKDSLAYERNREREQFRAEYASLHSWIVFHQASRVCFRVGLQHHESMTCCVSVQCSPCEKNTALLCQCFQVLEMRTDNGIFLRRAFEQETGSRWSDSIEILRRHETPFMLSSSNDTHSEWIANDRQYTESCTKDAWDRLMAASFPVTY